MSQRQPSTGPSVLGKRPPSSLTSSPLTSSPGPVQKRPAPSSPQSQVLPRSAEPPTRPREQTTNRSVLGKRPSEGVAGSAQKRRVALGEPQIEAGTSSRGAGVSTGAGGGSGRIRLGDPSGANSDGRGRTKVPSGAGDPEERRGSIGTSADVAERSGRGREERPLDNLRSERKQGSGGGASSPSGYISTQNGLRVLGGDGAKTIGSGTVVSQRVKEMAADAAERRAGLTGVSRRTSVGSERSFREASTSRRDQPDIGSPERRPQKGTVSHSGLKSREHKKVSTLTDDEVLWD